MITRSNLMNFSNLRKNLISGRRTHELSSGVSFCTSRIYTYTKMAYNIMCKSIGRRRAHFNVHEKCWVGNFLSILIYYLRTQRERISRTNGLFGLYPDTAQCYYIIYVQRPGEIMVNTNIVMLMKYCNNDQP